MSDEVEARLEAILERVDAWLKFAEAKNTALIVVTGGASAALAQQVTRVGVTKPLRDGLLAAEVCLLVALATALLSFFPQTDLAKRLTKRSDHPDDADNFYYYGHLAKYAPADLPALVARHYTGAQSYDPAGRRSHTDLAAQIGVNASITLAKLRLFSIAVAILMVALAILIVTLLVAALA
jgi:hypothetical protein